MNSGIAERRIVLSQKYLKFDCPVSSGTARSLSIHAYVNAPDQSVSRVEILA